MALAFLGRATSDDNLLRSVHRIGFMSATQRVATPVRQSNGADADTAQALRPRSRKRTGDSAGFDQSPESLVDDDDKDGSRIGVKRACNECRQQKVSLWLPFERST